MGRDPVQLSENFRKKNKNLNRHYKSRKVIPLTIDLLSYNAECFLDNTSVSH